MTKTQAFGWFAVVWCLGWMTWAVGNLIADRSTEIVADADGGNRYD